MIFLDLIIFSVYVMIFESLFRRRFLKYLDKENKKSLLFSLVIKSSFP